MNDWQAHGRGMNTESWEETGLASKKIAFDIVWVAGRVTVTLNRLVTLSVTIQVPWIRQSCVYSIQHSNSGKQPYLGLISLINHALLAHTGMHVCICTTSGMWCTLSSLGILYCNLGVAKISRSLCTDLWGTAGVFSFLQNLCFSISISQTDLLIFNGKSGIFAQSTLTRDRRKWLHCRWTWRGLRPPCKKPRTQVHFYFYNFGLW